MKNEIRKELLEKRNALSPYEVLKKSNEIISKLVNLEEFKRAERVMCYVSFGNEVYTHGLIKKYAPIKKLAVPVVDGENLLLSYIHDWKDLSTGTYGILEPKEIKIAKPEKIEIAIIPGIAFDKRGYRIGYGKGYFDRLLPRMNAIKVGIAYDFQLLEKIPHEEHDIKMDIIITERRFLRLNHTFYK